VYGSSGKESLKRLRAAIRLSCLKRFCVRQSAPGARDLAPRRSALASARRVGRDSFLVWAGGGCGTNPLMALEAHAKHAQALSPDEAPRALRGPGAPGSSADRSVVGGRTYTRLARSDHKNVRGGALAAKKSAALPPPLCGLLAPPRMRAQQSKKLAAISSSSACSGSILKSGKLPLLPVCLSL
jgi:hypothetical protein